MITTESISSSSRIARRCGVSQDQLTPDLREGLRVADEAIANYYLYKKKLPRSQKTEVSLRALWSAVEDIIRIRRFVYRDIAEIYGPKENWRPDFQRGIKAALSYGA